MTAVLDHHRIWPRRLLVAAAVAVGLQALVPATVSAHPLGNFTINHYAGIRVEPSSVALDVVIDRAEIPTFSERQRMDTNGDGLVSPTELEAERQAACARLAGGLDLTVAGSEVRLVVEAAGVSFPPGAGGLPTMRVVCEYTAALGGPLAAATPIHFADTSDAGRIGWREIVLTGDGVRISGSSPGATSVSDRLTRYPADRLAVPLAVTEASFSASRGGPSTTVPCIADAFALAAAPADGTPGFGCAAGPNDHSSPTGNSSGVAGSPDSAALASTAAAVPGGVGADVAGLLQTRDLTPPIVFFSILTAMALGAAHALTPGHGKTIMAAYLVGTRGTPRHAVALGLTVTASHTLGVLLLAVVILSVSRITPESFNHVGGIASGLLVVAIGGWLFIRQGLPMLQERFGSWREHRADVEAHASAHAAGVGHDHGHASAVHTDHDHGADDDHGHGHGASLPAVGGATAAGWHEHGGHGHTHLPAAGSTLTWRSLFALGLFGGLVPSINALIILLATLATGRAAFGIVLVVAFGAGMAIVLGGVGLGLVYASRRMARTTSVPIGRIVAWAPAITATVIVVVGLWVTGQAIWGSPVL